MTSPECSVILKIEIKEATVDPYRHQKKWFANKYATDAEFRERYNAKRREHNNKSREGLLTVAEVKLLKQKERYQNDPEYRARKLAINKACRERKAA